MASGALHDLFQDMYRYSDPSAYHPQEGALSSSSYKPPQQQHQQQQQQQSSYPYNPPSQQYQPPEPSRVHTNGSMYGGANTPSSGAYTNQYYNRPNYMAGQPAPSSGAGFPTQPAASSGYSTQPAHRSGYSTQSAPSPGPGFPTQAPPSYTDVQTHRDQVAYPYQPSAPSNQYTYPHSMSSSTSELSDISSGYGAYDGKPSSGSSPALGHSMTSPGVKVYSSASPADSSSGVGSYSCETPDQVETVCQTKSEPAVAAVVGRQDSFPPPPPPLPHEPATRLEQQLSNMSVGSDYGRQNSFPAPPTPPSYQPQAPFSPSHPPGAPSASSPYYGGQSPVVQPQRTQPAMPDAVLNMAAKGEPDKKPWAYAPDMDSIKEQRDKVRRSVKKDPNQDITQSPVYRMIHGLDAQKPKPRNVAPPPQQQQQQQQQYPQEGKGVVHNGRPCDLHQAAHESCSPQSSGPSMRHGVSFRVLQWLTDTEEDEKNKNEVLNERPSRAPAPDDELTFSGLTARSDIPSKSFHRLQSMTGGSEVDTSSIRANVTGTTDGQIGDYDQASIRYTGRNIPSKSFRMLQSMTGPEPPQQALQPRRQRRRPEAEPQNNPDDIVDISYVGGNIPSRSFKVLQQAMGQPEEPVQGSDDENADPDAAYHDMYYMGKGIPSRSFQLLQDAVGNDAHAVAIEKRRRRRNEYIRQVSKSQEEMVSVQNGSNFDEDAYLSGQIPINVSTEEEHKPREIAPGQPIEKAPWERKREEKDVPQENNFNEDAYLAGRLPVINDQPKQPVKPLVSEVIQQTDTTDDDKADQEPFDEDAYLAGRVNILGGETKPKPAAEKVKEDETPEWAKKRRAKLVRQMTDGAKEPQDFEKMHNLANVDERPRKPNEEADDTNKDPFDENAYLAGKVTIVGGGTNLPPRAPKTSSTEPRASWQKGAEDDNSVDEGFDEDAFLRGKIPILRNSVDRELPPRGNDKGKNYRERASWERNGEDDIDTRDQEFDESRYLAGRVPTAVRRSVDREVASPATNGKFSSVPSRTFHYLRRSMSRELSPTSSTSSGRPPSRQSSYSYDSADDDDDNPNKVYNDMVYVGKNIPSKTFLKLKKSVASRAHREKKKTQDPIENLRIKSLDVDSAVENLHIDSHDPDQYLEKLKESVHASNNIKIEADSNEVTDF